MAAIAFLIFIGLSSFGFSRRAYRRRSSTRSNIDAAPSGSSEACSNVFPISHFTFKRYFFILTDESINKLIHGVPKFHARCGRGMALDNWQYWTAWQDRTPQNRGRRVPTFQCPAPDGYFSCGHMKTRS
jgi:hypothetical protein